MNATVSKHMFQVLPGTWSDGGLYKFQTPDNQVFTMMPSIFWSTVLKLFYIDTWTN